MRCYSCGNEEKEKTNHCSRCGAVLYDGTWKLGISGTQSLAPRLIIVGLSVLLVLATVAVVILNCRKG